MNPTMEELCLMAAYGIPDRLALAAALRDGLTVLEEPELQELAENTAEKLESMTDDEFKALDRTLDFDLEGDDETEG